MLRLFRVRRDLSRYQRLRREARRPARGTQETSNGTPTAVRKPRKRSTGNVFLSASRSGSQLTSPEVDAGGGCYGDGSRRLEQEKEDMRDSTHTLTNEGNYDPMRELFSFKGAAMAARERTTPAVAKGSGFWHVPIVTKYSQETQKLLKVMMQESKLTNFQQRHLTNCIKRGDSLPDKCNPTSSKEPELPKPVSPPKVFLSISPYGRPHLRPAEMCRAGDAYTREKFRPQATRDLEKEKERLQNIFATGKDKVEKKPKKEPVKVEEKVPEPDRFEELVNEVQDRKRFLEEMEALGQGRFYRGIILTEISQKVREMEIIDKERSAELKEAMAKSFNIGNKPGPECTSQEDQ